MRKYSGPLWKIVDEMEKDTKQTVFDDTGKTKAVEIRSGYRGAVRASYATENRSEYKVTTVDSSMFTTAQTFSYPPVNLSLDYREQDRLFRIAERQIRLLEEENSKLKQRLNKAIELPEGEAVETEIKGRKIRPFEET